MTTETSAPRGRPRKFDPERAVGTAQRLFHAHGFDHVGVVLLAREIGIEQPSLYAAFNSKLGLFEAVLKRYAASDGQFVAEAFAKAKSVPEGLGAMLVSAATTYTREEVSTGCLVMEGAHGAHDAGARARCVELRSATQAFIAAYVEREHPGHGADTAAMAMIALAGLSASARTGMSRDRLLGFAAIAADGLLGMLGGAAGTTRVRA